MAKYKIAVIRGDGIGIEVMEEGLKIPQRRRRQIRHHMGLCRVSLGVRLLLRARAHDANRCP